MLRQIYSNFLNLKANAGLIFPRNNSKGGGGELYASAEMNSVKGKIQIKFSAKRIAGESV